MRWSKSWKKGCKVGFRLKGALLSLNDGELLVVFQMVSTVIIYKFVKVRANAMAIMPWAM